MQNYFLTLKNVVAALDYHSFSQLILRPFGWSRQDAEHERQVKKAGEIIADAIKRRHGLRYVSQKSINLVAPF